MVQKARGIQSIEVGGLILRALTQNAEPMALKDLTLATDLAPAQLHAYLTTYRKLGFVEQDQHSSRYKLGPFALRLALARMRSTPLMERSSRALIELSRSLKKVAMMIVWGPHGPTVVQFENGAAAVTLNLRQGTIFSVTGTASGRVFAAFAENDEVRRLIDAELSGQITERFVGLTQKKSEFEAAVKRDRELGYSATAGSPIPWLNAVSAPVFDVDGTMVLAITIFGSAKEFSVRRDSAEVHTLLDHARELSGSAS